MISHIVVDGSNIATEGRSEPSLAQLEEAVAEVRREHPDAEVTVIVDATFSHRIDPSELERFEKAALEGEYVHPPAGAIGRGDAFLLRVAEKVDATVLSNDSFQEFHGEHPWLFERGRLLGATPVPSVGWIFTPRTPVRGPKSRRALRDSDKAKKQVSKAIEAATKEAVAPETASERRGDGASSRRGGAQAKMAPNIAAAAVNDPLTFISFIADHPLGTEVEGQVESYTSHGAVVMVGTAQGYIPLANLADPPPRAAREVLKKGEHRRFVVTALDPQRRGVELSLPGVGVVSGRPSDETIAAELRIVKKSARAKKAAAAGSSAAPAKAATRAPAKAGTRRSGRKAGEAPVAAAAPAVDPETAPGAREARAPRKRAARKQVPEMPPARPSGGPGNGKAVKTQAKLGAEPPLSKQAKGAAREQGEKAATGPARRSGRAAGKSAQEAAAPAMSAGKAATAPAKPEGTPTGRTKKTAPQRAAASNKSENAPAPVRAPRTRKKKAQP